MYSRSDARNVARVAGSKRKTFFNRSDARNVARVAGSKRNTFFNLTNDKPRAGSPETPVS